VRARIARSTSLPTRFWVWLYGGISAVYLGDWARAVEHLSQAQPLIWSAPAHINTADCHLYLALAHATTAAVAPHPALAALQQARDRFAHWAALNPVTFQSKLLLIDAELARLRADPIKALAGYERSATAAAAAGFTHEQALAHELAAQLCLAHGLETARLYRQVIDESTRRLIAEVHLRAARADLVKQSHLTLLATLSASIAHEVNQPLASIVTSADASLRWLSRPAPELAEVQAGLQSIRQDGQRAASIIRALRTLAKQAPSTLLPVQIDAVIQDVLSMMQADIEERGVTLTTQLAAAAWVDADRIQLQQVILNLLSNALDAMDENEPARRQLSATSSIDRDHVLVSVMDRGTGLPPAVLQRIYDPFFTTKINGLGMGLAICRSIIEAHGGSMDAGPRKGGGAVFELRLPLGSQAAGALRPAPAAPALPPP
jgi:C4-dicarboxylate-specific signal transduction histidine kinase